MRAQVSICHKQTWSLEIWFKENNRREVMWFLYSCGLQNLDTIEALASAEDLLFVFYNQESFHVMKNNFIKYHSQFHFENLVEDK